MYLHEFQSKALFTEYGITVLPFHVATSCDIPPIDQAVVKIQVHSGGRGKAGGVKFCRSFDEIKQTVKEFIGKKIVTNQTGPEGVIVEKVLLDTPAKIQNEYYLAVTIDRKNARAVVIASADGGVEIEVLAKSNPEKVLVEEISENKALSREQINRISDFLGGIEVSDILSGLIKLFFEKDALLVEINPLAKVESGEIIALDAKIEIDDNALFRQKEMADLFDTGQLPKLEYQAMQHDLSYVALDGDIGCMVNGAGLAMATVDLLAFFGGKPANFLDVGGGASKEKIFEGFRILFSDPKVKSIFVHIFGGIMNCVLIAEALVEALLQFGAKVPVVIRMEGTNVEGAKKVLEKVNGQVEIIEDLQEAAKRVVEIVDGNTRR